MGSTVDGFAVPTSEDHYTYSYDEEILSCDPGATPVAKTPRVGYVTARYLKKSGRL